MKSFLTDVKNSKLLNIGTMKNHSVSKLRNDRNTWLMVAAIMGGLMAVSSAQAQNLLLNGSFEDGLPAGKVSWGYSGGNGSQFDVPNWFTPGATAPSDTGIEDPTKPPPTGFDGGYTAYLFSGDGTAGYAAQTTSYVIQSGDAFNLSLLGAPVGLLMPAGLLQMPLCITVSIMVEMRQLWGQVFAGWFFRPWLW